MPRGVSVHVGLNGVDPAHYAGWAGPLAACEFDANDMKALADKQGFESTVLLTKAATAAALIAAIDSAATALAANDMFFLTYSGHGGQVPDKNGDEADGRDETWCLFDRQVIDDELYTLWSKFKPGVRVLVLSDSCHSGTAAREMEAIGLPILAGTTTSGEAVEAAAPRVIPERVERETYAAHEQLYDELQKRTTATDATQLGAHVLLISGCQDNQTSADGDRNGLFTQTLRQVWHDGVFRGNYHSFWKKIVKAMPLYQSPNFFWAGNADRTFERQHPFTI
jgi:metacaspase-1